MRLCGCHYEPVSREIQPLVVTPGDELSFTVVGTDSSFRGRLEAALVSRRMPAVLMEDAQRGDFRGIVVRLLADEGGQPLTWGTSVPGRHFWEPVDGVALLEDIAAQLRCVIAYPDGLLGAGDVPPGDKDDNEGNDEAFDEAVDDEIEAIGTAFSVDALTWYTPGDGVVQVLGVFAQRVGQPLIGCPVDRGYIAAPTGDPDPVFESMIWASEGGLFLARSGNRRGAGFSSKRDPLVIHWWDEEWIAVDPSQPWEMDSEGRHVRDWLDLLLPEVETEPWTTGFGLDGVSGEELRIVLRSRRSDDETFGRLVRAVGLHPLLADVAAGRIELAAVEGAATYEATSLWGAMKEGMRDEMQRPVDYPAWASPLATWQQHRHRRSPVYLAVNGVAILVFVLSVVVTALTGGDNGLLWLKVIALTIIVADVLWPRRKLPEDPSESDRT